ncbi:hypothetical protein M431DRAFT_530948, partial [Trichoderma harzianum CBS 226.95]
LLSRLILSSLCDSIQSSSADRQRAPKHSPRIRLLFFRLQNVTCATAESSLAPPIRRSRPLFPPLTKFLSTLSL